ncbi:sporulation protein YjcZ [Thermoflavimicrobium daqui]|uniref:Sporulation protein YjcZ n=1 Tax=Thermoflavimicrobium daqui TaxID=2137476 RepID=A0A364K5S1_9BACL|nr:sporulation protein YjcZ [Thermoflavimicrobium daqui]RAL25633.1 sporulation protein YjcZ [Thermoflavimicrobium daqui]
MSGVGGFGMSWRTLLIFLLVIATIFVFACGGFGGFGGYGGC